MKTMTKFAAGLLLLVFALLPAAPASAHPARFTPRVFEGLHGSDDGRVIFGEDFTLESGETLNGDLVVFGGNVTLESDSTVNGSLAVIGGNVEAQEDVSVDGDLVMIGGNLTMAGQLDGSVVMIGGHLSLTETAVVEGDINTVGGNIDQAPGAEVLGQVVDNSSAPTITIPEAPVVAPPVVVPPTVVQPNTPITPNPLGGLFGWIGWAILMALTATVTSLFLHPQMDRVGTAIISQPLISGSFGLLVTGVAVVGITVMLISIILSPVAILAAVVFGLAWMFGLIALGEEVGDRLARQLNQVWTVPMSAGIGTLLLGTVIGLMVALIPCVGVMGGFLIGMVGLGGVLLTYFGSRSYPLQQPVPVEVPPEIPPAS